ncbi:MAG: EAL domain-containing protein [Ectothiorhodospiraceae bacterium]|nr:EAL domain-containing protein [Ectothiorhodospiraceae bacterium]
MVYQIQGLAFVVLGVVALMLPRRGGALLLAPHLWLLGLFGLLHGLVIFLGWEMSREPAMWLEYAVRLLLPLSYLPLLEFGRRVFRDLPTGPRIPALTLYPLAAAGVLLCVVLAEASLAGLAAGSRLFLGFPGALLSAAALLAVSQVSQAYQELRAYVPWLRLAGVALLGYGLLVPFILSPVAGLPGWLPTEADFLAWTSVPVRLMRAACTVVASVALVALVRSISTSATGDLVRVLETVTGLVYRSRNDRAWSMIYMAGEVQEITGYPASDFLSSRTITFERLLHVDDRERVWQEVQEAVAQRRSYHVSYRLVARNGELRWCFERGRPVFDDNDQLKFLEGHVVDASPLHKARVELEQFRNTLDRTLDAVFIFDADSLEFTYVNRGAEQQLGYRVDELLRMHPYDIKPDYPEPRFRDLIAPLLAGSIRVLRFETAHMTRAGNRVPVEVFLQYVAEAGVEPCFVAIVHDISERVASQNALREAKERLEMAERHAGLGHWEIEVASGEGHWSREMYRLLGFDPARGIPDLETYLDHIHPDDRELVAEAFRGLSTGEDPVPAVFRTHPDLGATRYLAPTFFCQRDGAGRAVRFVGTLQDVSERQRSMEQLKESEQRHRELRELAQREQGRMAALLSGMSIGILFEDRDSRVEYVNPSFRRMWAIDDRVQLVGRPTKEVLEHSTHRFARPDHASRHVLQVLDTHEISERFELDLYDGRVLTQLSYPVTDTEGRLIGRLWIYEDVTHERQTAQQLVYLAEHDPLTGLHNRHRFQEHLERMIKTARRVESRFALMYFDLDDFKHINDTFGHRAGDTVLVRAAGEVSSLVRSGEMFARLGGDEFAILTELSGKDDPVRLAERVVHAVSSIPLRFRGSNFRLTASVGIAIFPLHGTEAEDLVAHADTAMYQAKNQGKNTWAIYDPNRGDAEAMLERMSWGRCIAQALEQDAFELHFQGVYHAENRQLSHLEALVRMNDPGAQDRLLMPGQFIPVAEKSGQILEIDRWVLRKSVETLLQHPGVPALAVNISGRSFDEPGLPQYIQGLLEQHGVAPERLIIELTETAAVSEMQDAQRFIELLQQTGCMVCLDDFGSGFSTFAYLKYLAVQILKIDGMFIRDLPNNPDNQAFVKAMIDVASGLGKKVVAEFVEDASTLDMLRELGVDLVQGYHLDRPVAKHPSLGVAAPGVSSPGSARMAGEPRENE